MKKIALLHYAFPPQIGGVEVLMEQHALLLSEAGHDVKVLTGIGLTQTEPYKVVVRQELQSILAQSPELYDRILVEGVRDGEYTLLVARISSMLEEELADREVIIVHNMLTLVHNTPFIEAFSSYIKKYPEKKIIAWVHDHTYIGFDTIRVEEIKQVPFIHELLINKLEGVTYIAISEALRSSLTQVMNLSSEEIRVIPNGLNIKEFLAIGESIWEVVSTNDLLHAFPLVLAPVNILGRKNLEYALDVLHVMKSEYPEIKMIITGRSSDHRKNDGYEELIRQKVEELGLEEHVVFLYEHIGRYLDKKEVHDLYQISDIVFNFSKGENFGLPLLEAFVTKTPIVVSSLTVFKEVGGLDVLMVDVKQPAEATAGEVSSYLANSMVARGFHKAKSVYSLQRILKDYLLPLL